MTPCGPTLAAKDASTVNHTPRDIIEQLRDTNDPLQQVAAGEIEWLRRKVRLLSDLLRALVNLKRIG